MSVRPQHTGYLTNLEQLGSGRHPAQQMTRQVVLYLGSNIGNFTSVDAFTRRINRELQANFDLSAFDHYEDYNPESGEARSYLVSQKAQRVSSVALDLPIPFDSGEIVHTEISRKFTRTQSEALAHGVATRYEKTALSFAGFIYLASALILVA